MPDDPETRGVGAVLRDQVHRIDRVVQALGHLPALQIEHQRRDKHLPERDVAGEPYAQHHHTTDPQKDDVAAGDHDLIRIPMFELGRPLGPAEDREGPEPARKPGVERVGIAPQFARAEALACQRERFFFGFGDDGVVVRRVPDGQAVAPPHLARDIPIPDVLETVLERSPEAFRHEAYRPVAVGRQRRLRQRLHLAKPLQREQRLDDGAAARTDRYRMPARLDLHQEALRFEIAHHGLAGFEPIEPYIRRRCLVRHLRVEADDAGHRQAVTFADLIVQRIVRRRDLHGAGAEVALDGGVRKDRNRSSGQRQSHVLADEMRVAFVVGMHGDGGIAEHRLRPRSGDFDRKRAVLGGIA